MKKSSVLGLFLLLLMVLVVVLVGADENATTAATTTESPTPVITTTGANILDLAKGSNEKIARRIIDERLAPPRATEFAPWSSKKLALGEVRGSGPKVTEELDDEVPDKRLLKKSRNVGPASEPNGIPPISAFTPESKEKPSSSQNNQSSETIDQQQQQLRNAANGTRPAPRFHGNRPSDDRYGWRSSSYLGYNKDKGGYYDNRNHYSYDRYSSQRPSSPSVDGDRFGTTGGGTANTGPGGAGGNRPSSASYVSANYGFGAFGDRPRPGYGGGISGSLGGGADGDSDYPFSENGPTNAATNLQTQKAVALKALAGVALIGAAAALASNPVLLPISVLTGRKKRSIPAQNKPSIINVDDSADNYALEALLQGYIRPRANEVLSKKYEKAKKSGVKSANEFNNRSKEAIADVSEELVITPQCVARLACHVHQDYLIELEKSESQLRATTDSSAEAESFTVLKKWFNSLIHSNILAADYLSEELKSLIHSAIITGSDKNASCDQFSCLNPQNISNQTTSN